jgi:transcriptional regulator with XRE-family HTH domain
MEQSLSSLLRSFNMKNMVWPFSAGLAIIRPMITAAQCRAARALIRWNQDQLAEASQVGVAAIRVFEAEQSSPRRVTLAALQSALEAAGVIFIASNGDGPGVRLRKDVEADATP